MTRLRADESRDSRARVAALQDSDHIHENKDCLPSCTSTHALHLLAVESRKLSLSNFISTSSTRGKDWMSALQINQGADWCKHLTDNV
jgi:hypothetical protein